MAIFLCEPCVKKLNGIENNYKYDEPRDNLGVSNCAECKKYVEKTRAFGVNYEEGKTAIESILIDDKYWEELEAMNGVKDGKSLNERK